MSISTLEQYVEQKNRWGNIFGEKSLSLLRAEDRQKIADMIDCDLSPENLHCDGEVSPAVARRKYQMLTRCAQELLSIDPNVKFYEYG
jgi:hypothetical protein